MWLLINGLLKRLRIVYNFLFGSLNRRLIVVETVIVVKARMLLD